MKNTALHTRYGEFLLENAQMARKVMREAGIDYDELVKTPKNMWDELPASHREFLETREVIGPGNGLLGVYAMAMTTSNLYYPGYGFIQGDQLEQYKVDTMRKLCNLLVLLSDSISELRGPGGAKMGPTQFRDVGDLLAALQRLLIVFSPSDDPEVYRLIREMPSGVRKIWSRVYSGGAYSPDVVDYISNAGLGHNFITHALEQISGNPETRKVFAEMVKQVEKIKGSSKVHLHFIDILIDLCREEVSDEDLAKCVGVFGPNDNDDFIGVAGQLSKYAGNRLRRGSDYWENWGVQQYEDMTSHGKVLVMVPMYLGKGDGLHAIIHDISKFWCVLEKMRWGHLFEVYAFSVESHELMSFVNRLIKECELVGDGTPALLRKRAAAFKVRSIGEDEDD